MVKIVELIVFAVSAAAFGYGAARLFRKGTPKFFQLFVWAAGCYMIEELWVIVNALFGNGTQDGLVTVRLFGFFGCMCFMLSASSSESDRMADDGKQKKAKLLALLAPAVLLGIYVVYTLVPENKASLFSHITGFISIAPALFAAFFNLKHLLLPEDEKGYLKLTRGIDILSLVFYAGNYLYPMAFLYCSSFAMSVYDIILAAILFVIVLLCVRGAKKWKTSI